MRFPGVHAVATTPAQRLGAHFAHFPSRISLPRSRSRVGLRIVLFEACSAFTHVTACTLARSPIRDSLHQRLQPFRYLHSCSGCFRLERLPGGAFTHWEKRRLTTAHPRTGHSDLARKRLNEGLVTPTSGQSNSPPETSNERPLTGAKSSHSVQTKQSCDPGKLVAEKNGSSRRELVRRTQASGADGGVI